uniref:Copia protein n=1 Tax=Tanacetum cinerariifolium TaxID=118510 RepID=A0A6L2J2K5_TANCI|nr:copia protein [Tanacetum cinerariifolium]
MSKLHAMGNASSTSTSQPIASNARKQAHASHKAKNIVSTTGCLELLHMDLFGPSAVRSYRGNRYTLVIVDDYSRKVKELLNVTFDETHPPSKTSPLVDDDLDEEKANKVTEKKNLENDIVDETLEINEIVNIKESRNYPLKNVIGNLSQRTLRSQAQNQTAQPRNMTIIGTKWVFRNKLDENGIVSQNKDRLVAQCYNQQEGIDYDETYAPVAKVESIRILSAYGCALYFKLFQMDIKSAFLNGFINEEPRKDRGTRRGRYSTSSSSTFDQPSFSHLNDDDDGNGEGTSCASTPSPIQFAQILDITCEGACVFTDKWSLDELVYGVPTDGPYQTNPPFPDDIILSIQIDQEGQVRRIRHEEEIDVLDY